MDVTRRAVLEYLATTSDAERQETTTISAIATALGTDEQTISTHLESLEGAELVTRAGGGRVRITITGEEVLDLDADDVVLVVSNEEVSHW